MVLGLSLASAKMLVMLVVSLLDSQTVTVLVTSLISQSVRVWEKVCGP